ncbi:MAG: ABC transporter ATP-binding protein [Pseudomonadota bacterium]
MVKAAAAYSGVNDGASNSGGSAGSAGTSPTLLEVRGLNKSFGGVRATDDVTLDVRPGETHAIIGPNGAGKTTLISQLSGLVKPDAGEIHFKGRNITRAPPYQRARLGLARSFQITSVFMGLSVQENVALAVQGIAGHSFRFWRPASAVQALQDPARAKLEQVGLGGRAGERAANLSHGERRQLEIAMALATEPDLLLLDEPMAGMAPDESQRMVETLRNVEGKTILLVEHDMDAVFALADRISVLVYGRIIATDTPAAIRANEDVARAYLGEAA